MLVGGDKMPEIEIGIDVETKTFNQLQLELSSKQKDILIDLFDLFCVRIDQIASEMYVLGYKRGKEER
ncbi:hypothetical protein AM501_28565 [Aneurinibacillus migulanus]|uniref:hypothetical protein n=1 Tax=Aneurinibacillus migulanus TaxID=47500 RepID=UPI0005BD0999|nr:hypothetical protein [Aneurinibacillus migulanus]KIV58375.1 hypothetical protein TS64_04775 [Aneurinibacillus migulanus]KPD05004.1 hypothetical protein AM501_28565 [Aneurinibacillus migulanus]